MVLITGLWCTALSSTQNGPDHLGLRCDAQASWSFWPQSISSRSQPSGRLLKSPPSGISRTQARFTIPLPPPKAEAEAEEVEAEAEEAEEEAAERHHGCCPRLRRRWTQAMQWRRCSARRLVWPEAPTTATGIVVVVVVAVVAICSQISHACALDHAAASEAPRAAGIERSHSNRCGSCRPCLDCLP